MNFDKYTAITKYNSSARKFPFYTQPDVYSTFNSISKSFLKYFESVEILPLGYFCKPKSRRKPNKLQM